MKISTTDKMPDTWKWTLAGAVIVIGLIIFLANRCERQTPAIATAKEDVKDTEIKLIGNQANLTAVVDSMRHTSAESVKVAKTIADEVEKPVSVQDSTFVYESWYILNSN